MRWRDVGTPGFTWGDCLALVENRAWDDPLTRATQANDWFWNDPARDVLVTILDVLAQINAKTPIPEGGKRSNLPKPVERPWNARKKRTQQPKTQGRAWDEMEEWVKSRMATPDE